jgi:hypothetical protein
MPCRGIAYQPRVPTLGILPSKLTRSEGTPHTLRVSDIDPGPPYAVFLQNTPLLSDAVPRVGTLGWYALPRWGKLHDGISIPCPCPE